MFVVAQNLNSSDPDVHAGLAAGDRGWLEQRVRALLARDVDAIDLNAGTFGRSELDVLRWMAEVTEALTDLPLVLDSADFDLVLRVAEGRRVPPVLNSIDVDALESGLHEPALRRLLAREGTRLVVQLRRGARLPADHDDRLAWTEASLGVLSRLGVSTDAVFVDGVMLPWGDDRAAGRGLLAFVRAAAGRWPSLRTLVGLSNVGWGHAEPERLHASWLDALVEAGLGAVIVDALDPVCRQIARRKR